jgi:hypothetical protein
VPANPEAGCRCASNGNQMVTARTRPGRASIVRAPSVKSARCNAWDSSVEQESVPSILVSSLDPRTVQRLKERARVNGRSCGAGLPPG